MLGHANAECCFARNECCCRPRVRGDDSRSLTRRLCAASTKIQFNCQTARRPRAPNRSRTIIRRRERLPLFPSDQSPRGWSAKQRNHQFTPCGVSCLFARKTRPPPSAPSRHFRRSRKTASAPGRVSWDEVFTSPSPASTLQNGRSAVRLDARSRPGLGLRAPNAGFRPLLRLSKRP